MSLPLPLLSEIRVGLANTAKGNLSNSVEDLVRSALANCSTRVLLPQLPEDFLRARGTLPIADLAPSARSRVTIVDRRLRLWDSVRLYFQPMLATVTPLSTEAGQLDHVANALYHLVIATRSSAQVYLDIPAVVSDARRLLARAHHEASSEASMRLASLVGVFAQFQPAGSVPGFRVQVGYEVSLRLRLEEILEDAYLAEASNLRQFLAVASNVASVKRDLRRLLQTIARTAKWAKGVLSVTEYATGKSTAFAETTLELLHSISLPPDGAAVVLSPRDRPHFGAVTCLSSASANHFVYMSPARSLTPGGDALTYNVEYLDESDSWNLSAP